VSPDRGRAREHLVEEHYERFAGYRTRVLRVAGNGPPLLLLHGFSDSADAWRPVLRVLAGRARAAVAVDLPSHGRADALDDGRAMLPQLTAFTEAAAVWCGPGTVLAGNSLGGLVGLLLAERSEALGGVVGVCPAGFGYSRLMLAGAAQLRTPARRRAVAMLLGVPPVWLTARAARASIGRAFGERVGVDPRYALDYAGNVAPRLARRRLLALLYGLHQEALVSPLRPERVRCPVMLVWGERDPLTPPAAARVLTDALPGVRTEVLARVGHMPQVETPARLVELLLRFAPARGSGSGLDRQRDAGQVPDLVVGGDQSGGAAEGLPGTGVAGEPRERAAGDL
jgi:pimeloyl-ACP methyl ester carboxylesterase